MTMFRIYMNLMYTFILKNDWYNIFTAIQLLSTVFLIHLAWCNIANYLQHMNIIVRTFNRIQIGKVSPCWVVIYTYESFSRRPVFQADFLIRSKIYNDKYIFAYGTFLHTGSRAFFIVLCYFNGNLFSDDHFDRCRLHFFDPTIQHTCFRFCIMLTQQSTVVCVVIGVL